MLQRKNHMSIYLAFILLGELCYFLNAFFTHGAAFDSIIFGDNFDTFADYFKCVYGWCNNPYQEGYANYPALGTMMYRFVRHMIPLEINVESGLDYRSVNYAWMTFILFNIFCIWLASISIGERLSLTKQEKNILSLVIFLSAPVLFSLERGNQINLAFAFTAFFVFFYESENRILRELSFISLAIAAALKIYPAIYGLLLVKDKKWKECIRLGIYGIVLFFAPFAYYGKGAFRCFVESLIYFSKNQGNHYAYNYALSSIISLFTSLCNITVSDSAINLVCLIINVAIFAAFFLTPVRWEKEFLLTLLLIWIPKVSDAYVMLFMIMPFVTFLNSMKYRAENHKRISVYHLHFAVLFAFLFIPIALPKLEEYSFAGYRLTYSYIFYFICLILLGISVVLTSFAQFIKHAFRKDR